jgi:excinuclease ABC subunit A
LPKKFSEKDMKIAHQILKEIVRDLNFCKMWDSTTLPSTVRPTLCLAEKRSASAWPPKSARASPACSIFWTNHPSALHQRDNDRLLKTLKNLRDLGNTVIVVEHDQETIEASDWVIDIGPGAGKHGGELVAEGTPKEISKDKNSLTGKYLSGVESIPTPQTRSRGNAPRRSRLSEPPNTTSKMSISKFLWVNLSV